MEFDSHPADGESVQPSSKILPDLQQDPRTIKRENDSMDDFEHLEHEGSPLDESTRGNNASSSSPTTTNNILDVTSVQLIDVPRIAKGTELMDVASKLERNILDTSIPVDERILQPVPATPPPSADFQKFEQQPQLVAEARGADAQNVHHRFDAQDYDSHQQRHRVTENENRQVSDPKAATMAFMDTERGNIGAYNHNQQPQDPHPHLEDKDELLHHQKHEEHPKESFVDDFMEDNKADVTSGSLTARLAPDKMSSLVDHEDNVDELAIGAGSHFAEKKPSDFSDFTVDKKKTENDDFHGEFLSNIESSVIPGPQKSPEFDFLADEREETKKPAITNEGKNFIDDDTWNVVEKPEQKAANFAKKEAEDATKNRNDIYDEAPTKPLPPLPKLEMDEEEEDRNLPRNIQVEKEQRGGNDEKFEMSNDFMGSAGAEVVTNRGNKHRGGQQQQQQQQSGAETGDSEFESAPEQSPAKSSTRNSGSTTGNQQTTTYARKIHADDIAPKEIFTDMGLDAWFNPERLNPKVAALIYWRQPEKTGVVFGAVLGVLLSLAYFSLISVFAYLSLLTLTATVGFRVYKTVMQAIQKTSDGHPFKDILDVDLALPSEKVHEVADVAVAHANAAVAELRRLFLVEDFIDSLKFGVVLWCFTYLGSWFNGMTLIIIGVVALFTLPKVYETNKAQIDQNVALVHGKINEITAKVKAAIPLGKKAEPAKEE